ncbi:hypothetical protein BN2476_1470007 [Paraburkholderia piptadeniae]|uniref:Uncharacterized protein n=1 Tax=Paraburkholderia piptadeniae TaxID=1701573 RepID=A0A1N7SWX0_9BURK|nr:hypothetical protein BN2476_1470007 [Paraburkholderia piptadeniae]
MQPDSTLAMPTRPGMTVLPVLRRLSAAAGPARREAHWNVDLRACGVAASPVVLLTLSTR